MATTRKACRLPTNIAKRIIDKDIQFTREFIQNHKDDPYALNAVDKNGNTPLILAAIEGHGSIVNLLLANPHVDVNAMNHNGNTALSAAALMAWPHIAKILLKHKKIDVNHRDKSGKTALHTAIDLESPEFVEHLIRDKRTNVNIKDIRGQTALHAAVLTYNENRDQYHASQLSSGVWPHDMEDAKKVVMSLYNHHDMNKNIRDNNGKTALDYDNNHIITPTAPTKPQSYVVNADEFQQFMLWKKAKRTARPEERQSTNEATQSGIRPRQFSSD